jgi:hypothetical protein
MVPIHTRLNHSTSPKYAVSVQASLHPKNASVPGLVSLVVLCGVLVLESTRIGSQQTPRGRFVAIVAPPGLLISSLFLKAYCLLARVSETKFIDAGLVHD